MFQPTQPIINLEQEQTKNNENSLNSQCKPCLSLQSAPQAIHHLQANSSPHLLAQSNVSVLSVASNLSNVSNVSNLSLSIVSQGISSRSQYTLRDLLAAQMHINSMTQSVAVVPASQPLNTNLSPSVAPPQSQPSSLPGSRFLNPDDYIPKRIKRMNIPRTTIIDRKTGQAIYTTYPYLPGTAPEGTHSSRPERRVLQHEDDRNIVAKINRMMIEGGWKYSSLLGVDNHNSKASTKETTPTERDAQFPEVWSIVSRGMTQNFRSHGGEAAVHLVQCKQPVKIVHSCDGYGLTPTNSRYFVYGIFGMTRNLEPSLFALGFARDHTRDMHRHLIYYHILKTLTEANNPVLTQKRQEMYAKRAMSRRRNCQPQEVEEENYTFPELLFGKMEDPMKEACNKIRQQFGVKFDLFPSFQDRFETMRTRFIRHEIKTNKTLISHCENVIRLMLETNDHHSVQKGIDQLATHNRDFARKFRVYELGRLCLVNWQKRWVGFHLYQRYETIMPKYLSIQINEKGGHTLKDFIDNIIHQEAVDLHRSSGPPIDKYGLTKHNARLKRLFFAVEPKVMQELLELYRIGQGLRCEKDHSAPVQRYMIGTGKRHRKIAVEYLHRMWKCQCGYQIKVGIPCPHLFKVLHTEKTTKYEDYISYRLKKVRLTGTVELD